MLGRLQRLPVIGPGTSWPDILPFEALSEGEAVAWGT